MKKTKRMKFLQFVVLLLFVAALFVPQNTSRTMIAVIAITGIGITLLTFALPFLLDYLQAIKRNHKKQIPKRYASAAGNQPELEAHLWRQIKFQITGKLKSAYPEATWDFTKEPALSKLLNGIPMRIRTRNTGDYNFAEVVMDSLGNMIVQMMTIESLQKKTSVGDDSNPEQHVDPQSWYSLIGKPVLMDLVGDLQARGYQKLFINEQGEIYIVNGTELEIKGNLDNFPSKDYWPALTDIFLKDELEAEETDQALVLSWMV